MWRSVALRKCLKAGLPALRGAAHLRTSAWPARWLQRGLRSLELALAAAYRRKPRRWSRGCMLAKFSNHADGL